MFQAVNSHYKELHANMPSVLQEEPGDHVDVAKQARRRAARDEVRGNEHSLLREFCSL